MLTCAVGYSQEDWDDCQEARKRGPAPATKPVAVPDLDLDDNNGVVAPPPAPVPVGLRITLRGTGDRKLQQTCVPRPARALLTSAQVAAERHDRRAARRLCGQI